MPRTRTGNCSRVRLVRDGNGTFCFLLDPSVIGSIMSWLKLLSLGDPPILDETEETLRTTADGETTGPDGLSC